VGYDKKKIAEISGEIIIYALGTFISRWLWKPQILPYLYTYHELSVSYVGDGW